MQTIKIKYLKNILIVSAIFCSTILFARYNESYKACIKRYGQAISESNVSKQIKACTFKKSNYLVTIYFMKKRKHKTKKGTYWNAEGIVYARADKKDLSTKEIKTFLDTIKIKGKRGYRTWYQDFSKKNTWALSNTSKSTKKFKWDKPIYATVEAGKLYFFSDKLPDSIKKAEDKKLEGF